MGRVIALGFFDGVHIGHSALMNRTIDIARMRGLLPAAATFDRHPSGAPLINSLDDRKYLITHGFRIDDIICFTFNDKFKNIKPSDFVEMLVRQHSAEHLVVGYDYRFGRGGAGDAQMLLRETERLGIGCDIVKRVEVDGSAVSSSRIRELIANGEMFAAGRLLGHPHLLSGVVTEGRKLGRTLGFPTINLQIPRDVQPPRFGVYAVTVKLDGEIYGGVANVGKKPTVSNDETVGLEVNIFDYDGNAYGKLTRVEFSGFVRPEMKFDNVEALRNQVLSDREKVMQAFREG